MPFDKTIESLIKEAQARGEFDNLPGNGKPIDLTEYFNTPEDIRVAQFLLKNAGMVPYEVEFLREISALKDSLTSAKTEVDMDEIRKILGDKLLQLNLLVERRRRI